MKQFTKIQASLAVLALMAGAVLSEDLLARILPARLSTSAISFGFLVLLLWIFDHSPMSGRAITSLRSKLIFAGIVALTPLVLHNTLLGQSLFNSMP